MILKKTKNAKRSISYRTDGPTDGQTDRRMDRLKKRVSASMTFQSSHLTLIVT